MVMHTDQQNPHVHLVVKTEDNHGRKLHIDKPMLREWREDFARLMRGQGIAANATPRFVRGRNKREAKWAVSVHSCMGLPPPSLNASKILLTNGTNRDDSRSSACQVDRDAEGHHRELDEDRRRA
jgi:hypothetical protein